MTETELDDLDRARNRRRVPWRIIGFVTVVLLGGVVTWRMTRAPGDASRLAAAPGPRLVVRSLTGQGFEVNGTVVDEEGLRSRALTFARMHPKSSVLVVAASARDGAAHRAVAVGRQAGLHASLVVSGR